MIAAFAGWPAMPASAASLQVQPALIEVAAPGQAATLTLRNPDAAPINVQLRVFRWSQVNGTEKLEPTTDVVASPPATTLNPNTDYVVRIVRVMQRPVSGEESYRLLIDQLPDASLAGGNTVRLLVRYSLPVFFTKGVRAQPEVSWSIRKRGDRIALVARNNGASRLRVSNISIHDSRGKAVNFGDGLVGYVLSRSTMEWVAPQRVSDFAMSGSVVISGKGNEQQIHATATMGR
ncbi:MAG: molecular chaperone [Proteobacteria bacterium]|nr:molecular chaperone [Pseudomonadota bacterium]